MSYHPWGCKESDITEQLSTHTWLILTNQFYREVIQQLSDYYFMTACQSLARVLVRSTEFIVQPYVHDTMRDSTNIYVIYKTHIL